LQGCSIFESKNNDSKSVNLLNNRVVTNETKIEKYQRLKTLNTHLINTSDKLFVKMERKIQNMTMDLLSKVNDQNESITVAPVSISESINSTYTEVRSHMASLFINELMDFGFPVMAYQDEVKVSKLALHSYLSKDIYNDNSFLLIAYIKDTTTGQIKSTAQVQLETNLIVYSKDGIQVDL